MNNKILNTIFSLTGLSITIGVLGFLSSIVTLFIDINSQISVKWLLFVIVLSLSIIFILLKVIYDQFLEVAHAPPFETPIKYISEENILLIRKNENFLNSIIVGCYQQKDEIDRLVYLGQVYLVQEKLIQIKLTYDMGVLNEFPKSIEELKNLEIRPVLPVTVLELLTNQE